MNGEKQIILWQGEERPSISALARELGKTPNQIYSHLIKGTPVFGFEPHCVDIKLSLEDIERFNR